MYTTTNTGDSQGVVEDNQDMTSSPTRGIPYAGSPRTSGLRLNFRFKTLLVGSSNQYTVDSASGGVLFSIEAAVRLAAGAVPSTNLISTILKTWQGYDIDPQPEVSHVSSSIKRFHGIKFIKSCEKERDLNNLALNLEAQSYKEDSSTVVTGFVLHSAGTLAVGLTINREWILFDPSGGNGWWPPKEGAYMVTFPDRKDLLQFLKLRVAVNGRGDQRGRVFAYDFYMVETPYDFGVEHLSSPSWGDLRLITLNAEVKRIQDEYVKQQSLINELSEENKYLRIQLLEFQDEIMGDVREKSAEASQEDEILAKRLQEEYNEEMKKPRHDEFKYECQTCFTQIALIDAVVNDNCQHFTCRECFTNFIKSAIENRKIPITCPYCAGDDLDVPIAEAVLKEFIDENDWELYNKVNLEVASISNQNICQCPKPDCAGMCEVVPPNVQFRCPVCNYLYCVKCKVEWHRDTTCEKYQQWLEEDGMGDQLMDVLKNQNKFKQCPVCHQGVGKIEGCNHMTCRCGAHFCYICGKHLSHGEPYDHFREGNCELHS